MSTIRGVVKAAAQAAYNVTVEVDDAGVGATPDASVACTLSVTDVNEAPAGADGTVTVAENASRSFTGTDFGFMDVDLGDSLSAVRIDTLTLPVGATLRLSGIDVVAGDVIAVGQLGNVVFMPAPNTSGAGYASFTFSVRDTDGPAFDAVPNTLTVNVTAAGVNSAPVLAVNTGSRVTQGLTDVITSAELRVTDANNTPGQVRYTVISAPLYGRLELMTAPGVAVTSFTQADIDAGRVLFVHHGAVSASDGFMFTVSDGAGGSIGPTTFTLSVLPFAPQSMQTTVPLFGSGPGPESGLRAQNIVLPRSSGLPSPGPVWVRGTEYGDAVWAVTATEDQGSDVDVSSSITTEGEEGAIGSPPVNTVPGEQTVTSGSSVSLMGISVADGDGDLATVQLRVINGTITVMLAGEASIVDGAIGANVLTLSGSQDEVNATLSSLTYHAAKHYTGPDTLTVISTDRKRLSDTSMVTITVMPDGDGTINKGGVGDRVSGAVRDL